MRTRLDEIVEEELPLAGPFVGTIGEIGGRIAERAFRHGVERVSEQLFKQPGRLLVQPSPAEERSRRCARCHYDPGSWQYDRRSNSK
jgi:hypothetical protein